MPFCVKKCRYCGFFSTAYSAQAAKEFITALSREAAEYGRRFQARTFETVYIGGGTPTACSPDQLAAAISILKDSFMIAEGAEWTIEANPNSLSHDHLALLRQAGVNRISLGVQSFSDEVLAFLERPHDAAAAIGAFKVARSAGFDNISIDLMFGIPGQTDWQWKETLCRALDLRPDHVSAYSLSLDDGSRLKREAEAGALTLPDDESTAAHYDTAVALLADAGYERYEISNFALPGYACQHNINYWNRGSYLGLGPGAWSYDAGKRWRTIPDVSAYCSRLSSGGTAVLDEEIIDQERASTETIMLAMRTAQGLDLARYEEEYGADEARRLCEKAGPLIQSGLLRLEPGRLRLSSYAFLVANQVLLRLCS